MRHMKAKICLPVRRQRGWAGATRGEFGLLWLGKAAVVILVININPFGCQLVSFSSLYF